MADLQTLVVGDSLTDMDITVTDANAVVKDLTGLEARVFVRGIETGDKPESTPYSISGCSFSPAAKTVTRASGSFVTDGIVAGMVLPGTDFAEGTVVTAVAALTLTLNNLPITTQAGVPVKIWGGLLATLIDAPNGKIRVTGPGSLLSIAPNSAESYRGRVSVRNTSTNKVGWSNDTIAVIEFKAVTA